MSIAVSGGNAKGIMAAWKLIKQYHRVGLFNSAIFIGQASSASSRRLHYRLRNMEDCKFRLVKEDIKELDCLKCQAVKLHQPRNAVTQNPHLLTIVVQSGWLTFALLSVSNRRQYNRSVQVSP